MATNARSRRASELAANMARGAFYRRVLARQWELSSIVIKIGRPPCVDRVATFTTGGKARGRVVWIACLLECTEMAANTCCRCARVLATNVARGAFNIDVLASERELRAVVIKVGRLPGIDCVAGIASGGEAGGGVIRVACLLEVGQVAADASGGRAGIFTTHVARGASDGGVFAGKGKTSAVVIERGRAPGVDGVAGFAGGGEAGRDVIRVGGLLEIGEVAADAGGGRAGVFATDVARSAFDVGVFAGEGELCSVVVKVRRLPGIDGVAGITRGGKASAGVIRVGRLLEVG